MVEAGYPKTQGDRKIGWLASRGNCESPCANSFHCQLIEKFIQRFRDSDIRDASIWVYKDGEVKLSATPFGSRSLRVRR
jgi:hypothetical protein